MHLHRPWEAQGGRSEYHTGVDPARVSEAIVLVGEAMSNGRASSEKERDTRAQEQRNKKFDEKVNKIDQTLVGFDAKDQLLVRDAAPVLA